MPEYSNEAAVLFMKVGTHANEDLSDIITRKRLEIERSGYGMWGYGGNTCHPATMVQPFARDHASRSEPIILAMQPMTSKHYADPVRAEEYSADGRHWEAVPPYINVLGSRFALCIKSLEEVELSLDLSAARVAVGRSRGKAGDSYVRGRVDKACLDVKGPLGVAGAGVPIRLVAELVEPYAVFLRN